MAGLAEDENPTDGKLCAFTHSALSVSGASWEVAYNGGRKTNTIYYIITGISNGFIIQYSTCGLAGTSGLSVNLIITLTNTNYAAVACPLTTTNRWAAPGIDDRTLSTFRIMNISSANNSVKFMWVALGF